MRGMTLSVIIVSYKKIEILRDCLNSIKQYNDIGEDLEVIVSDNSPDDILYETIKKEYDWIKIIKNEHKGFGAGNNRGYEIATGKYLLFLNPDTILIEPIFKFTVEQFEQDKDLALFGVQLLRKDLKKNVSFFNIDKYGIFVTLKVKICRKINKFQDGKMFIAGADLFVRREAFEQAGRFDENIFMYKEEADLIKRIKLYATAKKTEFYENKHIIHLEGGTETDDSDHIITQLKRIVETDIYYAEKWGINVEKVLKSKRRYCRFKLFAYSLLLKRKKADEQKRLIEVYNGTLKKLECKN